MSRRCVTRDATVSDAIWTKRSRPCKAYYEIDFEHTGLRFIRFRNFYTAFISIQQFFHTSTDSSNSVSSTNKLEQQDIQRSLSSDDSEEGYWETILKRVVLMEQPHFESQAQDWHTIPTSSFSKLWQPEKLTKLRIFIFQPSPCWLKFELHDFEFYGDEIDEDSSLHSSPNPAFRQTSFSLPNLASNSRTATGLRLGPELNQQLSECIAGLSAARFALAEQVKKKKNDPNSLEVKSSQRKYRSDVGCEYCWLDPKNDGALLQIDSIDFAKQSNTRNLLLDL